MKTVQGTYEMVRKDGGSYRLDTEYVPAVKDGNPCGNYNQNVDHYVYMPASLVSEDGQETKPVRGYYGVVFKEADEHINITNYDYFNAKTTDGLNLDVTKKAYKVKSAYAIADQHTMNSIAESDPHAAIYRIDNSDISLAYEYAGLAESYKRQKAMKLRRQTRLIIQKLQIQRIMIHIPIIHCRWNMFLLMRW